MNRVVKKDGLYGVILTQTELDLIAAMMGQLQFTVMPQTDHHLFDVLYDHTVLRKLAITCDEHAYAHNTILTSPSAEEINALLLGEYKEHFDE